jgi:hypothetical protein
MRITIESTDRIVMMDGTQCRIWEGVTERGVPCYVFVPRVAVREDHDAEQFERELQEKLPPGVLYPLRLIL